MLGTAGVTSGTTNPSVGAPPTVSSTFPENAATAVTLNSSVSVTFSKAMTNSTLNTASFTLVKTTGGAAVTGTVIANGNTAMFVPPVNLAASTQYTATITTDAKDAAGNALAANYTWIFTTGTASNTTPPTVAATSPANAASSIATNSSVSATFSEAMTNATLNTASFTLMKTTGGAAVAGAVNVSGNAATFTPSAALATSTQYTATVAAGVTDAAGNPLAVDFTWNFTTAAASAIDLTPPTTPIGLVATPDGQFGVSLLWQPASDNVGVTGYRVERCPGAGCNTFAEIAAPNGAGFTDVGLVAATDYSYRVRATDAAGNFSPFSNVSSATTAIAPPPALGVLPAWVNALAIGQWHEITNTSLSSIDPATLPPGNTGPSSKVIAWTSFVVDTRTSKVYSAANGGHNDYAGNEVDVLDLERDQPVWSERLGPTPAAQLTNKQSYYADDRPASRHSYYGVTLNEFNDRIMLFGGAIWATNGGFHSAISSYNIGANTWSPSTTHGNVTGNIAGQVAAFALDPGTGDVYAAGNWTYGRWNRSSNTFTLITPSGNGPAGDGAMSAFDTTRGRILFLAGAATRHYYTLSSNAWTSVTLSGSNAANLASGTDKATMVYVPAIDSYLVRLGGSGGTVYRVNAASFEVTTFTTTGGSSVPSTENGPYNKFLYVPRLRGCVYVPAYAGNAWFLRVH